MTRQVYEEGGYGLTAILNPAIVTNRNPSATDLISPDGNAYQVGQLWENQTSYALFIYGGQGQWITIGGGTSEVSTLSGDTGTATPVAGNIKLAGTAAQIATAASGSTVTFSLTGPYGPATYTAHGVLIGEGAGAIVATTPGTDGQVLTGNTGADPTFDAIGTLSGLTAHGIILGQGASAFTALGVGATGTLLSGVSGADPAFTGSPSVSGSITAGTTITATLGNITATNGNVVLGTAGNKLISTSVASTITAGDNSFGTVALSSGGAVVSTTAALTGSIILLTTQVLGTVATPMPIAVTARSNGVSFTITSSDGTDTSTIGWMIIN